MAKIYYTKMHLAEYYVINAKEYLTKERYNRFCRLVNKNDRLRCLAGGLLMQKVFGRDLLEKIQFNEYGKPYIENESYFNLSHSGDYVVLAVDDKPVGVDIEQKKERGFEGIAKLSFHEKEQETLRIRADKADTFYSIWTLKESYMKQKGRGFNLPPKSFYFELTNGIRLFSFDDDDKLYFYLNKELEDYTVALTTFSSVFVNKLEYVAF